LLGDADAGPDYLTRLVERVVASVAGFAAKAQPSRRQVRRRRPSACKQPRRHTNSEK
jgi:hypothetical protein